MAYMEKSGVEYKGEGVGYDRACKLKGNEKMEKRYIELKSTVIPKKLN